MSSCLEDKLIKVDKAVVEYNIKISKYNNFKRITTYKKKIIPNKKQSDGKHIMSNIDWDEWITDRYLFSTGFYREESEYQFQNWLQNNEKEYKEEYNKYHREIEREQNNQYMDLLKEQATAPVKSKENSLKRTRQMIYDYINSNEFDLFITYTFNEEIVNRKDYEEVKQKMSKWLNNMKSKYSNNMQYIIVPEQHKDKSWHFHALMKNVEGLKLVESGYYSYGKIIFSIENGKVKFKDKEIEIKEYFKNKDMSKIKTIYNVDKYKYGFTTATLIEDKNKCSSYVAKYITKSVIQNTKGKRRYWCSKDLKLPEVNKYVVDEFNINTINEYLKENSEYNKKIVVNTKDYKNEINIFDIKNYN